MKFKDYLQSSNIAENAISPKEIRNIISNIRNELKKQNRTFGTFDIGQSGKIRHKGNTLTIYACMLDENGELLIPFESCKHLVIDSGACTKLTSFKNFPEIIYGTSGDDNFKAQISCKSIASWEGFPREVYGTVNLFGLSHISLSGINKYLKSCNEIIINFNVYKGPILSLLKINDLNKISKYFMTNDSDELKMLLNIINSHLTIDRDIIACSEDLINHGLKEYAKL